MFPDGNKLVERKTFLPEERKRIIVRINFMKR